MATRSFKVYQGEDLSPEFDYTDALKWEEIEVGSKAFNGESTLSTIVIRDEFGETGNEIGLPSGLTHKSLAARNVVKLTLGSNVLWSGRIGVKDYSRDGRQSERYRNAHVQLFDRNKDLDEIIVDGNFNRAAETDVARVQGLVASFYSGVPGQIGPVAGLNPRPTTRLNGSNSVVVGSNLVSLPAQDYTRTSALEVLRGIAATANKLFFVTEDGTTLFYDGHDSSAYQTPLVVSDRESEIRGDASGWTFAPIWNVGAASTEDGMEQRAGLRLYYGTGTTAYVDAYSETVANQYAHTAEIIFDDTIVDPSQAQKRVNREVDRRSKERRTYSCSVGPLTDDQIPFVRVGQLVRIKARAIPDADDQFVSRRIVELKITTPVPGTWFAHMRLDQPLGRAIAPGAPPMPQPVGDTTCTPLPAATYYPFWDGNEAIAPYPNPGPFAEGGDGNVFATGVGHSGSQFISVASLSNPWAWYTFGGDFTAGTTYTFSFWSKVNATAAPASFTFGYDSGTTFPVFEDSVSITGVGAETEWTYHEMEWTAPSNISSGGLYNTSGVKFLVEFAFSSDGVALDDGSLCISIPGVSIGGPGEGTTGTDGFVGGGTVIEHGDLSGKGASIMHAATQVSIADAGGYFTGTTVEAALQEAGAATGAAVLALIKTGSADPSSGSGVASGQGSIYLRTDGTLWVKYGSGDTNWREVINE